ncbi:MAG: hypothetical protein REI96_22740, partial [Flavobacterium nitrogenifigens]|uniref:hypothetical protein n=1 Tax=Flavobacterium nitrogenifigens TaxID=1617283 RepID=UPI002806E21B
MCKIYNTVGSLTTLKSELDRNKISDFKSLKEVMVFQDSYPNHIQQLISHHKNLIEQEKEILSTDLPQLKMAIDIQKQEKSQVLTIEINQLKEQL